VAVGVYAIGYNVAVVGMMVNIAVVLSWLPEASRNMSKTKNGPSTPWAD
jgi:O-antigen/teichoic acid export membrane protein